MYGYQPQPRSITRPPPPVYSTSFQLTENPISEGGKWINTDANQTVMKTLNGAAYGTQTDHAAPPYDDSSAYLLDFGNDYEIEGIIVLAAGLDAVNREVELLLRWFEGALRVNPGGFGDTRCDGYEINVHHQGNYLQLGRFKATNFYNQPLGATPATGDKFRARAQAMQVKVWWNDVLKIDFDLTTALAADQITNGNPGIGAFRHAGATVANTDFGFSEVTVRKL